MVQSTVCVKPFTGVQGQQLVNQITSKMILHIRPQSLLHPASAFILGHLQLSEQVQLGYTRPNLFIHCSAEVSNKGKLVLLCVALHYWTPGPHLCHHTASAPHINRRAIVPLTKQQLWRSIPECHDSVCVAVSFVVLLDGESPGKTKVSQLQYPSLRDQDVGGFHIPVQDLVVVDVVEALEDLLHHLLDLGEGELNADIAEQAGQIMLAKVKDQVEGCF